MKGIFFKKENLNDIGFYFSEIIQIFYDLENQYIINCGLIVYFFFMFYLLGSFN